MNFYAESRCKHDELRAHQVIDCICHTRVGSMHTEECRDSWTFCLGGVRERLDDVEGVLAECFDDLWEQAERHPEPPLFLARNGWEALIDSLTPEISSEPEEETATTTN